MFWIAKKRQTRWNDLVDFLLFGSIKLFMGLDFIHMSTGKAFAEMQPMKLSSTL